MIVKPLMQADDPSRWQTPQGTPRAVPAALRDNAQRAALTG